MRTDAMGKLVATIEDRNDLYSATVINYEDESYTMRHVTREETVIRHPSEDKVWELLHDAVKDESKEVTLSSIGNERFPDIAQQVGIKLALFHPRIGRNERDIYLEEREGHLMVYDKNAATASDYPPHIFESTQEALEWVNDALATDPLSFEAFDELFEVFPHPQLIDKLRSGARLGRNEFIEERESKWGGNRCEIVVVEVLLREQGHYHIREYPSFPDGLTAFDYGTPEREVTEEEALKWLKDAKCNAASDFILDKAGKAVFPDVEKSRKPAEQERD